MKDRKFNVPLCIVMGFLVALQGCNFSSAKPVESSQVTAGARETTMVAAVASAASLVTMIPTALPTQSSPAETSPAQAQPSATLRVTAMPPSPEAVTPQPTQSPPAAGSSATQTAVAPAFAELAALGVDPSRGAMGWIQPQLHLEVNQYLGQKYDDQFSAVVAQDFVMSSDITWNTQYGGSGCAFAFRSDGKQGLPSQYLVVATRQSSGHVYFAILSKGQMVVVKDFYPASFDPLFNSANGATNRLTVVGRGTTFTIYSNGTWLGDVNPTKPLPPLVLPGAPVKPWDTEDKVAMEEYKEALAQYKKNTAGMRSAYNQRVALWSKVDKSFASGIAALGVVSESGKTVCDFTNAWLWLAGAP